MKTMLIIVLTLSSACTFPSTPAPPLPSLSAPSQCHYYYPHQDGNALPDPACTPGKADPRVTQDNLLQTICSPGYSATIRAEKPASYFANLKSTQMRQYGVTQSPSQYEEDHLISLELGGSNDPLNLWPEPGPSPNPKDKIENALHTMVCAHPPTLTLAEAQHGISTDWTTALQ